MDATILGTDGEFPSHHALKRFFSQCGFRVEIARDRWQWLTKARRLAPEVVIIDLDASWGGDAAVAAFRSEMGRRAEKPALFIIGNAPPAALARRTGVPPGACFQKPVPLEDLLDHVGLAIAQLDLHRRTGRSGRRMAEDRCLLETAP